jgi:DNA polymerase-1
VVFEKYTGDIVFHHKQFDLHWLSRAGVKVDGFFHDTKIMNTILDSGNSSSLKPLAVRHIDPRLQHSQDELKHYMSKNGWTWDTIPWDFAPYWTYASLDPVLTAGIYEVLEPKLHGVELDLYNLELSVSSIIQKMEERGIRINVPYCQEQYEKVITYAQNMGNYIKTEWGCSSTPAAISKALEGFGVELTKQTANGGWSTEADVLEGIDHPLAEAVLEKRRAEKLANAYFKNLIEFEDNGIIHADISPLAARTSRMSISRPALQQIPARRGKLVRDAFIPRDGNLFIDVDFDQIEQRLITHYSQEPAWLDAFAEAAKPGGTDVFTWLGRQLYNDPDMQKSDVRRTYLKNTAYGTAYGGGAEAVAHQSKLPVEETQQFINMYFQRFPKVKALMDSAIASVRERSKDGGEPWIRTFYGRRLVVPSDRLYAATNYIIQGTACDFFKRKLVALDNLGLADCCVLPVHDEFLFDVPQAEAQDIAKRVEDLMQDNETFAVPITAGASIGANWGEVH